QGINKLSGLTCFDILLDVSFMVFCLVFNWGQEFELGTELGNLCFRFFGLEQGSLTTVSGLSVLPATSTPALRFRIRNPIPRIAFTEDRHRWKRFHHQRLRIISNR